ncbi:hypothetical protein HUZ36_04610 [Pseudoalteromonas sp. McH1-7]|uniref:hypothetical protein n=1 Tax=Pseudoalteromonas sp. McH1-7 TaxID=2745574 RepID=UPI001590BF72|nr:hypothetical protein [Pseudoalteromonas sp. McH1-7]NUZ10055.1 hypothetical protein [Pseudoalteromonas sp. McH1-7]
MPTPVAVYRWDDEGAPQITERYGTANEIKAVLDACLISGYGTKQPLGWSKVFDDSNSVVYQNDTAKDGSGGMVRFWPHAGDWSARLSPSSGMLFQAAKSFINSEVSHHSGFTQSFCHPVSSTTQTKAWVIIGTARAFYLILAWVDETGSNHNPRYKVSASNYYQCELFVGDYIKELTADAGQFIAFHSPVNSDETSSNWVSSLGSMVRDIGSTSSTTGVKIYAADNSANFELYSPRITFERSSIHIADDGAEILGLAPVPLMNDASKNIPALIDLTKPTLRGYMPGLINTMRGLNKDSYWPQELTIDGQRYFQLHSADANCSHIWINMEQW